VIDFDEVSFSSYFFFKVGIYSFDTGIVLHRILYKEDHESSEAFLMKDRVDLERRVESRVSSSSSPL